MAQAQKTIIVKDEAALKAYLKEDEAREMTAADLLSQIAHIYGEMRTYVDGYNHIVRKVELSEEDEKKLATYERNFEILNEDYARYAKWHHYATILEAVKDEKAEAGKQYTKAISEAVKKPYYRVIKVAARMDNKAGAKLAKESESKGLVSLSELQSFAQACIGADGEWSRKAATLRTMLTARVAMDVETGKEVVFTSKNTNTDILNLYRSSRSAQSGADNKKGKKGTPETPVSNTKLTEALKETVNAMLPEDERKKAVHIADVRYLIAAMTGATKNLGEIRVNKDGQFIDLIISVLARITGVTEGYSILA